MMQHPNPDMLLRIAQADAFCAATEYVKRSEHVDLFEAVQRYDLYQQHPTHKKLRPGMYTDDTQMSISVAETLLDNPTALTYENFAEHFFAAFKRDPRDGYSRGFQKILEEAKSPEHMRMLIVPDSIKNGACMRAVPIGVISDPKRVVEVSTMQATVTHATWGGCNSAAAVSLMSHFSLYDSREFSEMYGWCCQLLPAFELFREPWVGGAGLRGTDPRGLGIGMSTAHAVHTLLTQENSLMKILKRVVEWGGDTDSVGAVAWGIASARYKSEQLPEFLEQDLEVRGNLKYGPEFLKKLGSRLMTAY